MLALPRQVGASDLGSLFQGHCDPYVDSGPIGQVGRDFEVDDEAALLPAHHPGSNPCSSRVLRTQTALDVGQEAKIDEVIGWVERTGELPELTESFLRCAGRHAGHVDASDLDRHMSDDGRRTKCSHIGMHERTLEVADRHAPISQFGALASAPSLTNPAIPNEPSARALILSVSWRSVSDSHGFAQGLTWHNALMRPG